MTARHRHRRCPTRCRSSTSACRCSPMPSRDQGRPVQQVDWRIPADGDRSWSRPCEQLYGPRPTRSTPRTPRWCAAWTTVCPLLVDVDTAADGCARSSVPEPHPAALRPGHRLGPTCATRCGGRCARPPWPRAGPTTSSRPTCGWRPARSLLGRPYEYGVGGADGKRHRPLLADVRRREPRRRDPCLRADRSGPRRDGLVRPRDTRRDRAAAFPARRRRPDAPRRCVAPPDPIDVFALAAQGVQMGDDVHMRTQGTTSLLIRNLLPLAGRAARPGPRRAGPSSCPATTCSSSTSRWPRRSRLRCGPNRSRARASSP